VYTSILDAIPWYAVGLSILQTVTIYWLLVIGMKLVGRRVFGEMGPQDMIILLLIAEACDLGLSHEDAGYWGTVFSVLTILIMGAMVERIPPLRNKLSDSPIELVKDGQPLAQVMKKSLVEESDLLSTAREYGIPDFSAFETMTLESDGSITGVLKPEYRGFVRKANASKPVG
jgi:uncharacterized membrane protein YcaP (DUF421 family)